MSGSTSSALRTVLTRMALDAEFAEQIRRDPAALVSRYGLTADEVATVCGARIDTAATRPGRLEERLSRSVIFPGIDVLATVDPDVTVDHPHVAVDHPDAAYKLPVATSDEAAKAIPDDLTDVSLPCADAAPATDLGPRPLTIDTVVPVDGVPGGVHVSVQSNPDGTHLVVFRNPVFSALLGDVHAQAVSNPDGSFTATGKALPGGTGDVTIRAMPNPDGSWDLGWLVTSNSNAAKTPPGIPDLPVSIGADAHHGAQLPKR